MTKALSGIKTGQVTFAARHSVIDGKEIAEGDILGMEEGDITVIGKQTQRCRPANYKQACG
jgi:dihydroxyacetone kinase-like predicted kinase